MDIKRFKQTTTQSSTSRLAPVRTAVPRYDDVVFDSTRGNSWKRVKKQYSPDGYDIDSYVSREYDIRSNDSRDKWLVVRSPCRRTMEHTTLLISAEEIVKLANDMHFKLTGRQYYTDYYVFSESDFQWNILRAQAILISCLTEIERLITDYKFECDDFDGTFSTFENLSLQRRMVVMKTRNEQRKRHNQNLIDDLQDKEMEIDDMETRMWKLKVALRKAEEEISRLEEDEESQTNKIWKLKVALRNAEEEISSLAEDKESQTNEIWNLEGALLRAEKRITNFTEDNEAQTNEIWYLNDDLRRAELENTRLTEDKEAQTKE